MPPGEILRGGESFRSGETVEDQDDPDDRSQESEERSQRGQQGQRAEPVFRVGGQVRPDAGDFFLDQLPRTTAVGGGGFDQARAR